MYILQTLQALIEIGMHATAAPYWCNSESKLKFKTHFLPKSACPLKAVVYTQHSYTSVRCWLQILYNSCDTRTGLNVISKPVRMEFLNLYACVPSIPTLHRRKSHERACVLVRRRLSEVREPRCWGGLKGGSGISVCVCVGVWWGG